VLPGCLVGRVYDLPYAPSTSCRGCQVAGRISRRSADGPRGPVELCCHPALAAYAAGKSSSHQRPEELEYLLSGRFRQLLKASRARLVSYWKV